MDCRNHRSAGHWPSVIGGLVLTIFLSGCQQTPVSVDYNPDTDFNRYQNYNWETERSGTGSDLDPLLAERVQTSIKEILNNRGFKRIDSSPDFKVRYFLAASAKTRDSRGRGGVGVGGGSGGVGVGVSMNFPIGGTRIENRLQLTLDFIDGDSGKLSWRAVREVVLPDNDPQGSRVKIQEAVRAMLDKFPPGEE